MYHLAPSFIRSRGFSLIELLLVLGVLAILLVAAFAIYPQVRDQNHANKELMNLSSIKASVENLYAAGPGGFEGLNTAIANQAGVFPQSMNNGDRSAEAKITTAWGTNVLLGHATRGSGTNLPPAQGRAFSIRYDSIPTQGCMVLATAAATTFDDVWVGSISSVLGEDGQLDMERAAAGCSSSDRVAMRFISDPTRASRAIRY